MPDKHLIGTVVKDGKIYEIMEHTINEKTKNGEIKEAKKIYTRLQTGQKGSRIKSETHKKMLQLFKSSLSASEIYDLFQFCHEKYGLNFESKTYGMITQYKRQALAKFINNSSADVVEDMKNKINELFPAYKL